MYKEKIIYHFPAKVEIFWYLLKNKTKIFEKFIQISKIELFVYKIQENFRPISARGQKT